MCCIFNLVDGKFHYKLNKEDTCNAINSGKLKMKFGFSIVIVTFIKNVLVQDLITGQV